MLFLTLCYVTTFALHDMRRLLDRPPPDERRSANRALACADEAGGEAGGGDGGGGGGGDYAAPNHVSAAATGHQLASREYVSSLLAATPEQRRPA